MSDKENKIPNLFEHTDVVMPNDCILKISPSKIAQFFEYPSVWYKEEVLKQKQAFEGNTATTLGTICHKIYENVTEGIPINRDTIDEALEAFNTAMPHLNLDLQDIRNCYPEISRLVVNEYILPTKAKGIRVKSEVSLVGKVMNGIYIGGTCDRIEGDCIVDFKTVGSKPNEETIPFNYRIQLLAYAVAARLNGYEINRIRIVYGVKPLKTIPARKFEVTKMIDYEDEKLISDTLKLIGESVLKVRECPELTHLIFKSMDLKV